MNDGSPKGLRQAVDRLARKADVLEAQNERLVRMVLMQRLRDGDIDFSEGLDLLDNYRPEFTSDPGGYELRFSPVTIDSWLTARKVPA